MRTQELYSEIVRQLEKLAESCASEARQKWFRQQHREIELKSYGIKTPEIKKFIKSYKSRFEQLNLKEKFDLAKDELHVAKRDDWREWLRKNHDTKEQVWLIYYKKHTGKPTIPYGDSVEEALCFGWIDSIIKRIDDEKYARKFTPHKAKSRWSEANKRRARKMVKEGKMTEVGLARIREAKKSGEWFKAAPIRKELVIPPYMKEALAKNKKALKSFNNLAKSYKRQYVGWITSAKREETQKRRLAEAIKLLEKNEKLGMK